MLTYHDKADLYVLTCVSRFIAFR